MNSSFLELARKSPDASFASEAKILERLQTLKKSVIISADHTRHIEDYYLNIKTEIENQKTAYFFHYHVKSTGISNCEQLFRSAEMNEAELINYVVKTLNPNNKYVFVVDNGFRCLFVDGKVSTETDNCLSRYSTMKKELDSLVPISKLPYIFELYHFQCSHGLNYCDCFGKDSKILPTIREQELRNFLLKFLITNVKGSVQTEFCTDFENDEESVDIFLNDAKETAIIEVKFAFSKKYYAGKTHYNLEDRAKKGYQQLDKYAVHLAKDNRRIEYGYLYIFHMLDKSDDQVKSEVDQLFASIKDECSADFNSLYSGTCYNNMHEWKFKKV